MVDDHYRDAFFLQLAYDIPQFVHLAGGQRRGRFVQDQQLCVVDDGAADRHHLFICHTQALKLHIRVDVRTDLLHGKPRRFVYLFPIHKFYFIFQFPIERDVLRHRQVRKHGKILVNHLDAAVDRVHGLHLFHFFSIDPDRAFIGIVYAGDRLDQRRFSTAVFTSQAVNFPFSDLQVDSLQSVDAAEGFFDAFQFQKDFISHSTGPPFFLYSLSMQTPMRGVCRRMGVSDASA